MNKETKSSFYQLPLPWECLFEGEVELLPSVSELFELELAYLEYNCLPKHELSKRLAYFKTTNGQPTMHYLMCKDSPTSINENRSSLTKTYFKEGVFSTGYATHGLFPYRGKFHPQLIKAIVNIIGIKKGDKILDPMCGSGTTNIEAALMGIDSYAIDLNPFCQFMTQTKYDCLSIEINQLNGISSKSKDLFSFFSTGKYKEALKKIQDVNKSKIYSLALLAFLDSMGYSRRIVRSNHEDLFAKVLKRYEDTIANFSLNGRQYIGEIGDLYILDDATATSIPLDDNSIDGIITSPPYSFAIDYVQNDSAQLAFLGYDLEYLKINMIGLSGNNTSERLNNYFSSMDSVCSEASRLLKANKYFVMIIGSNTNQTGGIRLENKIIESSKTYGLELVKSILKPIKGMRNTMKDEYILFFQKR